MKNKVIAALADQTKSPEERYNSLLNLLSMKAGIMQIRNFQLGYSPSKLERLEYELQKMYEVTDLEIHEYQPEEKHQTLNNDLLHEGTTQNPAGKTGNETEISQQQQKIIDELEKNTEAKQGLKIRDQFPFLNDPNCPDEYKILVSDKITAWKEFAKNHTTLVEGIEENEAEEKLYQLAKSAIAEFQLNDDIRKEFEFYQERGKVLGEHPKLSSLKIKEEINELSEAGLVEMKNRANKNASKAKMEIQNKGSNEAREKRLSDWSLREKLSIERLENEFKK